jgi:hypothetical protein
MAVAVIVDVPGGNEQLAPAARQVGDPPPEITFFPVYRLILASAGT